MRDMSTPRTLKTGRPKKTKQNRKDDVIRVRVTSEQKVTLTEAADLGGHDVSSWLRGLGLREAQRLLFEAQQRLVVPKAPEEER
jgi:uncharacterized protein (DUF1778 family)